MNIAFVVVTYKPNKKALGSLVDTLGKKDVIVVDNTGNNRGYAGGANVGVRKALEQGYEWIVMVNDDVTLSKYALSQFLDIVNKSEPAIIGPVAGRIDAKRWTTIVPATQMDWIDGAFTAIHAKIFQTIGEFYAPYFIYYEDIDLCIRAKRAGFPLRWFPIDGIRHEGSVVLGRGSFRHQYYAARNHLKFVERLAPLRVKIYEYMRLQKTVYEHVIRREWGALLGIFHYFIRRFGRL